MRKPSTYMLDDARPVVVTGSDGTVIAQNKSARRMLGPGTGKYCWDVVGKMEKSKKLPCRQGCVMKLLASDVDTQETQFKQAGKQRDISCRAMNGVVVCMFSSEGHEPSKMWPSLSTREQEILRMLADGETTSSTADRLDVCESTIRTHVERIRSKLCVNTRAAAVAEGFRLGFLE
ncbi:MAG: LuxR C-terminal-related transcriptional regulator [Gammaproteobacteria bacterium]|nr:LuxR C-terminal-related transcriptional regulator [Gammaproteobacteria bacterium]